jgi:hypothetical protein
MNDQQPDLILPSGTQVVTRVALRDAAGSVLRSRGAVGVIVEAPVDASHAYQLRFADGAEISLRRTELSIRKQYQRDTLVPADAVDERE